MFMWSAMADIKFKLNLKGLNELMKSDEMVAALDKAGEVVARKAGSGFSKRTHQASWVAICNVFPDSKEAAKDNYENNSLIKALSSAGLSMK